MSMQFQKHDEEAKAARTDAEMMEPEYPNTKAHWRTYWRVGDMACYETLTCNTAVVDGYIYGLHNRGVLSPLLFMTHDECRRSLVDSNFDNLLPTTIEQIAWKYLVGSLLLPDNNPKLLREAFVYGYMMAYFKAGRYCKALFEPLHRQMCHVVADLVIAEKKKENARRAEARIVCKAFGAGADILRNDLRSGENMNDLGELTSHDDSANQHQFDS